MALLALKILKSFNKELLHRSIRPAQQLHIIATIVLLHIIVLPHSYCGEDIFHNLKACYEPDRVNALAFIHGLSAHELPSQESGSAIICSNSSQHSAPRITQLQLYYDDLDHHANINFTSLCSLAALTSLTLELGFDEMVSVVPRIDADCMGAHLKLLQQFTLDVYTGAHISFNIRNAFSGLRALQELSLFPLRIDSLLPIFALPSLLSLDLLGCSLPIDSQLPLIVNKLPPNLTSLDLSLCSNLYGPLPGPFNNTPLLRELSLDGNFLNSTLEDFALHSNLPSLTLLSLSSSSLLGPLGSATSRLPSLEYLYLSYNELSGPFPAWIRHSSSLKYLDLSYNRLTGAVPQEWQHLHSLEGITLSGNLIAPASSTGRRLPEWLFRLPNLTSLGLASTGLQRRDCVCDGMLSLLNKTLEWLDLSANNFTGPDIFNCFARHNFTAPVFILDLSSNPLSFPLSRSHPPPAGISELRLSQCALYGPVTDKFAYKLTNSTNQASILDLSDNHLQGFIPLQLLAPFQYRNNLSYNQFTGFGQNPYNNSMLCTESGFILSYNNLSTDLASIFHSLEVDGDCLIKSDDTLDLSHNQLVGKFPTSAARALGRGRFNRILLSHNLLEGSIPYELGVGDYNSPSKTPLRTLKLNNNQLIGILPTSVFNRTSLKLLDISYNHLQGDFTTLFNSVKQPTHLCVLSLAHNQISGAIPPSFGLFTPALQLIDLSHNQLSGTIPPQLLLPAFRVSQPKNLQSSGIVLYEEITLMVKGRDATYSYELQILTAIDLSGNHLSGTIPPQLGELVGLRYLNLSRNNLSGSIPADISKLSVLESLDLSVNQLQGKIPSEFSALNSLAVFNVSFNEALEGAIPEGSTRFPSSSFKGDPHLCGEPVLPKCGTPNVSRAISPPTIEGDDENEGANAFVTMIKEWVPIPALVLGWVIGLATTLWLLHANTASPFKKLVRRMKLAVKIC